jgi:hypothetical protein
MMLTTHGTPPIKMCKRTDPSWIILSGEKEQLAVIKQQTNSSFESTFYKTIVSHSANFSGLACHPSAASGIEFPSSLQPRQGRYIPTPGQAKRNPGGSLPSSLLPSRFTRDSLFSFLHLSSLRYGTRNSARRSRPAPPRSPFHFLPLSSLLAGA